MIGTFEKFLEATPSLTGAERLRVFEHLRPELQADCLQRLREEVDGQRLLDNPVEIGRRRRSSPSPRSSSGSVSVGRGSLLGESPRSSGRRGDDVGDDVLDTIPPAQYVEALTGESVPAHGSINCPLPGHDDRSPSFKVYADPGRGWYCFGCHRGGGAIDLAAELFGIEPRGEGFHDLRRRIAERLLNTPVAA